MSTLLILSALVGCNGQTASTQPATTPAIPTRIVSLAPSATEVLFALGLGDRVLGVTRYCDYPPEASSRPKVGGYLDVGYEAILSLGPDLVVLLREHREAAERLSALGIPTLAVDHSSVRGILDSLGLVGERCGATAQAALLRSGLEERLRRVEAAAAGRPRPRVVVAVGRSLEGGAGGEVYISGNDGYYADLVRLAGGENAYRGQTMKFPALSAEGLVRLDPDVIIEVFPTSGGAGAEAIRSAWNAVPGLRAAASGRVVLIEEDFAVVPGPRFIDLLERMASAIAPAVGAP